MPALLRKTMAGALFASLVLLAGTGSGCLARKPAATETAPPPQAPCPEPPPPAESLPDPRVPELELKLRASEIARLEKEAEAKEMERRLASQQRMLDDAIQEVVRAKAKLRSLESRAEAASQMAETEIAYKSLKARVRGASPPDLAKVDGMMAQSAKEFEQENFGGALYLSSQAKALIQGIELELAAMVDVPSDSGEIPFTATLSLRAAKRSNVRDEPSLQGKVLVTIESDTPVTAYSHKGDWIRVKLDGGVTGWIHQSLVQGR